ncbi:MAG: ATP-dependent DNA ligase [Terriglobales bacterium]
MREFADTCEAIAGTSKRLLKTGIVAEYLKSRTVAEASVSAVFLSGKAFPAWEETTLQVGGRLLWQVVGELSGKSDVELTAAYRRLGDLGAVVGEALREHPGDVEENELSFARPGQTRASVPTQEGKGQTEADIPLHEERSVVAAEAFFRRIAAARGPAAKAALVRELLGRATPLEAKYLVKIMTGDLRIGLKESLVEEAIARAFGGTLAEVQRANMLLGDIGETVRLAARSELAEAHMRMFHPLGFMLANPVESAEEALSYFEQASIEDKYDGIRAQAHVSEGEVRFFSRTRDEITESFPELPDALAGLPQGAILDGEIVAWSYSDEGAGRALPFSALQQRLGRKKVSAELMRRVPVVYLVFDVLYAGGELLLNLPLRERMRILDELLAAKSKGIHHQRHEGTRRKPSRTDQGTLAFGDDEEALLERVFRAPAAPASKAEELETLFTAAQARGNEGLMIKDLGSPYTPGRRGKSWLKIKRELATLDVVVTAVEYGHGKRIGVLSDYTFAVRDGERLVNIGKAYSGLTDAEIAEMTQWFLEHTVDDQGFRREVEPKIVLEVAFNNVMKSDRHESGYALRFPRIVRLRPDKLPEDADTIERAREIYLKQERVRDVP